MSDSAHIRRHRLLHRMFDELLADYLLHASPAEGADRTSIHDPVVCLLEWSARQLTNPDHRWGREQKTKRKPARSAGR